MKPAKSCNLLRQCDAGRSAVPIQPLLFGKSGGGGRGTLRVRINPPQAAPLQATPAPFAHVPSKNVARNVFRCLKPAPGLVQAVSAGSRPRLPDRMLKETNSCASIAAGMTPLLAVQPHGTSFLADLHFSTLRRMTRTPLPRTMAEKQADARHPTPRCPGRRPSIPPHALERTIEPTRRTHDR